jgi:hypothetical protein
LGDVTIAFFYGTDLLASYSPPTQTNAPSESQLAAPLRDVISQPKFAKGERTAALELPGNGLAVYSLVTGSAATSNVGYAVARPRKLLATPVALFENASSQEVRALPFVLLVGGALGLAGLGLLFIFLERDLPLSRFLRRLSEISKDERDRLIITEWRGIGRRIAEHINQAIDRQVEKAASSPSVKKKINLDEILGPTPGQQESEAFFGFARGESASSSDFDSFPAPPPPDAVEPPKRDLPPPPPKPGASPPPSAAAPKPPPPPRVKGAAIAATKPAAAEPIGPIATATIRDTVDESAAEAFDEEEHFKQVYDQYIKTRKECGESVDGIDFDKFLVTVRKNRDQIVAKHNAKAARFTVYVKEGKAALKATPIKKSMAG